MGTRIGSTVTTGARTGTTAAQTELSLSTDPAGNQLDLLVSNPGFDDESHDDTFALQKGDVEKLSAFLQAWLKRHC